MKKTKILYWVFTSLFAFLMLGSAIPDVLSSEVAVQGMHDALGYPMYFIPFIGVAKVLGVIVILLPVSAKLKEWAYAGLAFDLIGATYSIIASGGTAAACAFMLMPLVLLVLAYTWFQFKGQATSAEAARPLQSLQQAAV